MTRVAGVDGTPGGWAVVIIEANQRPVVRKVTAFSDLLDGTHFEIIAVDVRIGLLGARPGISVEFPDPRGKDVVQVT